MSATDLYGLLPFIILAGGSMFLLLAGPFTGRKAETMNYGGALIALAAGLAAAFYRPDAASAGGIVYVDGFARMFVAAISLAAFFVILLSIGYTRRRPLGSEEYPALVLFAAFGMSALASAMSLLGVFLGIESMSLALYVLLASNKADALSGESGLKYLIVGAISTAFFAYGLALIFVATGTLSLYDSLRSLSSVGTMNPIGLAGWAMLLVGLGFKTSLFPFHYWAPDVYQGGPSPVIGFLSTASKASVVAIFLRMAAFSGPGWDALVPALWAICALTMAFGNIAALTQDNVKRLLAYSSIAQMGYVLLALIASPKSGVSPAVFYLIIYMIMELGAFGVVSAFSGKEKDLGDISDLRGLGYTYPARSAILSVCLFSLAGLPPTAGFIGKFGVFYAALKAGYVWLAVIGIATAVVSIYYYLRVVVYLYMRHDEAEVPEYPLVMPRADKSLKFALGVLVIAVVVLGIMPGSLLDLISAVAVVPGFLK